MTETTEEPKKARGHEIMIGTITVNPGPRTPRQDAALSALWIGIITKPAEEPNTHHH